jgi:hypothetical protein
MAASQRWSHLYRVTEERLCGPRTGRAVFTAFSDRWKKMEKGYEPLPRLLSQTGMPRTTRLKLSVDGTSQVQVFHVYRDAQRNGTNLRMHNGLRSERRSSDGCTQTTRTLPRPCFVENTRALRKLADLAALEASDG